MFTGTSPALLDDKRLLTYKLDLVVAVGHAEGRLAVDFAGRRVTVASLRE